MKIYAGIFKSHSRSCSRSTCKPGYLVFTRRKLWDDIERTLWALETAQNHFEQATEPSLIDCYIYEWNAAQLRYQFLLRKFKNMED